MLHRKPFLTLVEFESMRKKQSTSGKLSCPECSRPGLSPIGLSIHRSRAHGVAGKFAQPKKTQRRNSPTPVIAAPQAPAFVANEQHGREMLLIAAVMQAPGVRESSRETAANVFEAILRAKV